MVLYYPSISRWPASAENGPHVCAGLFVRRNAVVPAHGARPGVVGGHREHGPELVGEAAQVGDAGIDVLPRIEGIRHAEVELRGGHQLHQALGSGRRFRARAVSRFDGDNRVHQVRVDGVPSCGRVDDVGERPLAGLGRERELAGLGREREEAGGGGDEQGDHEATAREARRHGERRTLPHPKAVRVCLRHRLARPRSADECFPTRRSRTTRAPRPVPA